MIQIVYTRYSEYEYFMYVRMTDDGSYIFSYM